MGRRLAVFTAVTAVFAAIFFLSELIVLTAEMKAPGPDASGNGLDLAYLRSSVQTKGAATEGVGVAKAIVATPQDSVGKIEGAAAGVGSPRDSWTVMGQHAENIRTYFAYDYAINVRQYEQFLLNIASGNKKSAVGGKKKIDCGCPRTCGETALAETNGAFTCGVRVAFLMDSYGADERTACAKAALNDGPCGPACDPDKCEEPAVADGGLIKASEDPAYSMQERADSLPASELPDPPFNRYEGVVMVTKVLWGTDMKFLKQMICAFTAAYNRHHFYDIIVFTTEPWTNEQKEELQAFVLPAKLLVMMDSPPLEDQLATLGEAGVAKLDARCKKKPSNMTWFHHCLEPDYSRSHVVPLGYNWQAEFRSYHIWRHPALKDYKYMMWMDSDALSTKNWPADPIQKMVEHNLVAMFDNFNQGRTSHQELNDKMVQAYNRTICNVQVTEEGNFVTEPCVGGEVAGISHIHGFHHVTDLDFYRSEENQRYLELQVEKRFSRYWDDQLAVTLPAAMLAPERTWGYRRSGMNMGIHHNGLLDGKEKNTVFGHHNWFKANKKNWPAGEIMCDGFMTGAG